MKTLWMTGKPFPTFAEMPALPGARHCLVHTAAEDGYHFLLGAAVAVYHGTLHVGWENSWREENDDRSIFAERRSKDGGQTWSEVTQIAGAEPPYARSHGVYFPYKGRLYAYCPRARFFNNTYPDMTTEGYVLGENGVFVPMGTVLNENFWPMCAPIPLENGTLLMAGLNSCGGWSEHPQAQAAVALSDGDPGRWEMIPLPNPHHYNYWGETTVLPLSGRLTAIVRGSGRISTVLVSESADHGRTWSGLEESNFPFADSKPYALRLSNGLSCLAFNVYGRNYRLTLALAVGHEQFEQVYIVRDGFDAPPVYQRCNEWCYPYLYEDTDAGLLYIVYARNKEDCAMTVVPVENLAR